MLLLWLDNRQHPGFVQKFHGRSCKLSNSAEAREERQIWKIALWCTLAALAVIALNVVRWANDHRKLAALITIVVAALVVLVVLKTPGAHPHPRVPSTRFHSWRQHLPKS